MNSSEKFLRKNKVEKICILKKYHKPSVEWCKEVGTCEEYERHPS
jgi:hypothetical protein